MSLNTEHEEFHWLTIVWTNVSLILFESGIDSAKSVAERMNAQEPEEIAKLPEAWQLINKASDADVLRGLHMITNHVFDWESLGNLFAMLLEPMVVEMITV